MVNKAPYPADILLLGAIAVVADSESFTYLVEEAWFRRHAA